MFAKVEAYLHRLRHRLSRSEWAIRHLGLTPTEGASEAPGLLLLQIDGFARSQLERALAARRMPFLARLLNQAALTTETSRRVSNLDTPGGLRLGMLRFDAAENGSTPSG